jgi:hypothetical protein
MRSGRVGVWMYLALVVPMAAAAQGRQPSPGDPERLREIERLTVLTGRANAFTSDVLAGPVVTDAPFSADATTTVTQVLGDGTRIEQTTNARFFRDRAGRVRREQTILGLGALNAGGNMQTITVDPDPGDGTAYTLDPLTRTARRVPRISMPLGGNMVFRTMSNTVLIEARGGGPSIGRAAAATASEEMLGARQFEGVRALGRKTTRVIPTGQIGNDRPIEVTDERWESPELRMLIYSRNSDPRTGVVEYRLTNINRSEPAADLFMIPHDYTVSQPPLPPPAPAPPSVTPPAVPLPAASPAPPGPGARGRGARDAGTGR